MNASTVLVLVERHKLVVFVLPSTSANTTCTRGGYLQLLTLVALFIEVLTHILHAQNATCTEWWRWYI